MRIISKFKDYYDGVQYYGQDQDLIYVRNKEYPNEYINLENHFQTEGYYFSRISELNIIQYPFKNVEWEYYDSFILGFCGELYRGYIIRQEVETSSNLIDKVSESFYICYNQEQLNAYTKPTKYSLKNYKGNWQKRYIKNRIDCDYFKIDNKEKLKELFFKYNVPYFIISCGRLRHGFKDPIKYKNNLTLNPILNKYQFYKVKDSYTAFQDIAMFIGGVLPRVGHEMIEVSNNDLIVKKGFDLKWSFRKKSNSN